MSRIGSRFTLEDHMPSHKRVTLFTTLLVLLLSAACDEFPFFGDDDDRDRVSAKVGSQGGSVELDGVAEVEFPAGAFASPTRVEIERKRSDEWSELFSTTSIIFGAGESVAYQVAVNTGTALPQADSFAVTLHVPQDFASSVPADHAVEAFVLLRQTGGSGESIDSWELVSSDYDVQARTLRVRVPSFVLAPAFSTDGDNEIRFTIASTPGTRQSVLMERRLSFAAAGACATSTGKPLDQMILQEGFGELRKDPSKGYKLHWGADLTAPIGTPVYAALSGTVKFAGIIRGYGNTIILRHGAAQTLYAHLSSIDVTVDQQVTEGAVIGRTGISGNAGGTQPHLHYEIAPRGDVLQNKNKADPYGCVAETATGDIVLRDNGSLADDAFVLTIDGNEVLRTTPGGEATRRTGPLRLGDHDLRLLCELAPDDVGTYEILLSGRTVFKAGIKGRRSGTLPQGRHLDEKIVVYGTDVTNPTPSLSRPNDVRETPRR
jgi:murein DD-endopeptidase MepM/ murein hydrolase activator NlpD